MARDTLTIGRLARAAGVNVETIRYYQRLGLVPEPPRPTGGYRHYPPETVDRIRFIKRAQRLGFTLQEIGELLALGDGACEDVRRRAERKCAQIAAQIRDLQALHRTLEQLITRCREGDGGGGCPIIESIAGAGEPPA